MLFKQDTFCSDEQLIELIKKGDEKAFSTLYNRNWDKLYSIAYNRLLDDVEAEEIVQDIFLSIWNRREQLVIKSTVASYLAVSVKYLIINKMVRLKRQLTYRQKFLNVSKVSEYTTDLWLYEKELRDRLEKSVNTLPEKCKIVFKMSREEGKNVKEISNELALAEKTIEAHITKALKILRNNLLILWLFIFL